MGGPFLVECLCLLKGNSIYVRSKVMATAAEVMTGTVRWFNTMKGYGFIQPDGGGDDVFVHISALERSGISHLPDGQRVSFELMTSRGKTSATNIKLLDS